MWLGKALRLEVDDSNVEDLIHEHQTSYRQLNFRTRKIMFRKKLRFWRKRRREEMMAH